MTETTPHNKQRRSLRIIGLTAAVVFMTATAAWFAPNQHFQWIRHFDEAAAAEVSGGMSKDEFGQRVKEYLLEHPEVIAQAINRLEARQRDQEAKQAKVALQSHADEVFRDPEDPVSGNPNGDATLVEFFDYNCPYCKAMAPIMTQAENADPKLRIVYKEFPILGPNSLFAAKAALAANKQGKYVAFHRALYQVRGHVDESAVLQVAKSTGLDIVRLQKDMQAPEISAHIDKNIKLARILGINGTPGFAVGDRVLTGATDLKTLQTVIDISRKSPVRDE
jgi:protein-disulfide isomerase